MDALNALLRAIGRAFRWWVYVTPWERCIRVRFGSNQVELGPGVHLMLPFADRAFVHSTRLRLSNPPAQTFALPSGETLMLRSIVSYRIVNLSLMYERLHDAEDAIHDRTLSVVSGAVPDWDQDAGREPLESAVRAGCDYSDWGIAVEGVTFSDFVISARSYRLLAEGLSKNPWSQKLDTAGDGMKGRGY